MSRKSSAPPYFFCPWELVDASALQALQRGDASPEQQRRALDWVINSASRYYDISFQPGQPDAGHFMEGRRFVGGEVVKLLRINTAAFLKEKND